MTNGEMIIWIMNLSADIGKVKALRPLEAYKEEE